MFYIPTLKEKFDSVIGGKTVYIREENLTEFKNLFKKDALIIKKANNKIGYDVTLTPSKWESLFI